MSSANDNELDNSTTALLQPDTSDTDLAAVSKSHDEALISTSINDDQQQQQQQPESQPTTNGDDNDTSSSQPTENSTTTPQIQQNGETSAEPPSDDLNIVDENKPEELLNSDNKPSDESPKDNGGKNLNSDQIEEDNSPGAGTAGEGEEGEGDSEKTPIAPSSAKKPSRSSRLRATLKSSLPDERVRKARMATSMEDIGSLRLWKGIVAEFLGTLLLTLVGCGSCINLHGAKNVTSPVVQIALCFGLSVATIVWAIGHVSGGHINPAVTAAMLATRKISLAKAVFFIIFQLIGAVVGAGLLYGMTPSDYHENLGATLVNGKLNAGQAVGVEMFITFVLVFVVFASVDSKRRDLNGSTPLTIGLSVTMCHLFAVDFTGSSMNTARSFGPALVMGKWADHWVYWLGPILGGVLAGLLYENLFAVNASLNKAKACLLSSDYDDEKYQAQKMKIRILEEDPDEPKDDLTLTDKNADSDPSSA